MMLLINKISKMSLNARESSKTKQKVMMAGRFITKHEVSNLSKLESIFLNLVHVSSTCLQAVEKSSMFVTYYLWFRKIEQPS